MTSASSTSPRETDFLDDKKGPPGICPAGPHSSSTIRRYAVNELPQPQPPVAFGFLKLNPLPIIVVT